MRAAVVVVRHNHTENQTIRSSMHTKVILENLPSFRNIKHRVYTHHSSAVTLSHLRFLPVQAMLSPLTSTNLTPSSDTPLIFTGKSNPAGSVSGIANSISSTAAAAAVAVAVPVVAAASVL